MNNKFYIAGMLTVSFLSAAIAVGHICVSLHAMGRIQELQRQNTVFADENSMLRTALLDVQVKANSSREEIVISVKDTRSCKAFENRNFGNVKSLGKNNEWKGAIGVDSEGHVIFKNEAYGLRAAILNLLSYERKHKINTIDALINRYCTGNREEYKKFLSKRLGIGIEEPFSIRARIKELVLAVVRFETGHELPAQYKDLLMLVNL